MPYRLLEEDYKIGGLDAWTDDKLFLNNDFIFTKQFIELSKPNRCFLCGRRGSGKSAIAIMLKKKNHLWDHYLVIQGEIQTYGNYIDQISHLEKQITNGLNIDIKRFTYLLWRYVLRIVILQTVVEYSMKNNLMAVRGKEISRIKRFLSSIGCSKDGIGSILVKVFKESLSHITEDSAMEFNVYASLLAKFEDVKFAKAMSCVPVILETKNILITLDTLESYKIHSTSMKQGLRGVILSVLNIMSDSSLTNIGIRFFLPAEIFEDVSSEIPAKTAGTTVFLRWQLSDLLAMLSKRFMDMVKRNNLLTDREVISLDRLVNNAIDNKSEKDKRNLRESFWYDNKFLPTTIVNHNNYKEDCFALILRHTQRRPRELIFILNQIIKKAYENNELPYISEESVQSGLHDRITLGTLLRDTLSPYETYIDEITDRARSAFSDKPRVMSGRDLTRFAKAFYDINPITDIDSEKFVGYLMRAGVIGQVVSNSNVQKSGYCTALFEYLMQDRIPFNNSAKYYIHPVMGDYFNMKVVDGYGVVYPIPLEDTWLESELMLT